jgi:hypothetical protein
MINVTKDGYGVGPGGLEDWLGSIGWEVLALWILLTEESLRLKLRVKALFPFGALSIVGTCCGMRCRGTQSVTFI